MGQCFELDDIHPSVKRIIEGLCDRDGEASHQAITDDLLDDPEALVVIDWAVKRCPCKNRHDHASNMVAWLSAHYTKKQEDVSVFSKQFARRKQDDGRWTYLKRSFL